MKEPPFSMIEGDFKKQTIFFTVIGITFFLPSQVAFSLWFVFLMVQFVRIGYGQFQTSMTWAMETDQIFGAMIAYGIGILWVARRHLKMVIAQMFRPARSNEPTGRYLPISGRSRLGPGDLPLCLGLLASARRRLRSSGSSW